VRVAEHYPIPGYNDLNRYTFPSFGSDAYILNERESYRYDAVAMNKRWNEQRMITYGGWINISHDRLFMIQEFKNLKVSGYDYLRYRNKKTKESVEFDRVWELPGGSTLRDFGDPRVREYKWVTYDHQATDGFGVNYAPAENRQKIVDNPIFCAIRETLEEAYNMPENLSYERVKEHPHFRRLYAMVQGVLIIGSDLYVVSDGAMPATSPRTLDKRGFFRGYIHLEEIGDLIRNTNARKRVSGRFLEQLLAVRFVIDSEFRKKRERFDVPSNQEFVESAEDRNYQDAGSEAVTNLVQRLVGLLDVEKTKDKKRKGPASKKSKKKTRERGNRWAVKNKEDSVVFDHDYEWHEDEDVVVEDVTGEEGEWFRRRLAIQMRQQEDLVILDDI
jgi:hypothetical protein